MTHKLLPTPEPSTIAEPFALVLRGGSAPGQRPRTKMAFLVRSLYKGGQLAAYRGYIAKGSGYTKKLCTIALGDVIASWPSPPSSGDVMKTKAGLVKAPGSPR